MIINDVTLLRDKCNDVSVFEAQSIISKLESELSTSPHPGIGLAANQIAINKRVCIIRVGNYKLDLANPVIVDQEDIRSFDNEGCLSFQGEYVTTKRFNEVFVKDMFHPAGVVCTGLIAVVVQHEIAHTNGETMYDYRISIPEPNEKCWCGSNKKYSKCHIDKKICL